MRLVLLVPFVLAACGRPPFGAAQRVNDVRDVDEVEADGHGVVILSSGNATTRQDSELHTVDAAGTTVDLARGLVEAHHLAITGTDVYFLTADGVHKIARAGGRVELAMAVDHPTALAVEGTELIVAIADTILAVTPDGTARSLVVGAGDVGDLAADHDHVVWTDRKGGRVMRARRDGSDVVVVADAQATPVAVVIADGAIVWITKGDTRLEIEATVAKAATSGGQPTTLFRRGYEYEGVTVDHGWVYWTWGDVFSSVHRVRLRGGGEQQVVSDRTDLDGVALDAGSLWVGAADGLYRARRK